MRPRQLITICNAIAKRSIKAKTFPVFAPEDILAGTRDAEGDLASEVINSFSSIYPKVSNILAALIHMPLVFDGNELDRRAPQSASEWDGNYSPAAFRRLVTELGIVGKLSRVDERHYIDATFEYSLSERLDLTHRDRCVMHPMFYRRLNVTFNSPAIVIPFSSHIA